MSRAREFVSNHFTWMLEMRWLDALRIPLALSPHTAHTPREIDPNIRYDRGMIFPQGDKIYLLRQDRNLNPNQSLLEQGCQLFAGASLKPWTDEEFCLRGIPEGKTEEVIWKRSDNGKNWRLKAPNQGQRWRIYDGRTRPSSSGEWEEDK